MSFHCQDAFSFHIQVLLIFRYHPLLGAVQGTPMWKVCLFPPSSIFLVLWQSPVLSPIPMNNTWPIVGPRNIGPGAGPPSGSGSPSWSLCFMCFSPFAGLSSEGKTWRHLQMTWHHPVEHEGWGFGGLPVKWCCEIRVSQCQRKIAPISLEFIFCEFFLFVLKGALFFFKCLVLKGLPYLIFP